MNDFAERLCFFLEQTIERPVEDEVIDLILEGDDIERRPCRKRCALGNGFDFFRDGIQSFPCRRPDEETCFCVFRDDVRCIATMRDDSVDPDIVR